MHGRYVFDGRSTAVRFWFSESSQYDQRYHRNIHEEVKVGVKNREPSMTIVINPVARFSGFEFASGKAAVESEIYAARCVI